MADIFDLKWPVNDGKQRVNNGEHWWTMASIYLSIYLYIYTYRIIYIIIYIIIIIIIIYYYYYHYYYYVYYYYYTYNIYIYETINGTLQSRFNMPPALVMPLYRKIPRNDWRRTSSGIRRDQGIPGPEWFSIAMLVYQRVYDKYILISHILQNEKLSSRVTNLTHAYLEVIN